MTISTTAVDVTYSPDGATTVFALPFAFADADDVVVELDGALLASGYSISGAGDEDGGTLTFEAAPDAATELYAYRETPLVQEIAPVNNSTVFASVLGRGLDQAAMRHQEIRAYLDRVVTEAGSDIGLIGKVDKTALAASNGTTIVGYTPAGTGAVARTLQAVLRNLPNFAQNFAAAVNGTTDDTAALNAALAANRQVRIDGTLYINGVVNLPEKFEIVGEGPFRSSILLGPAGQLKMSGTSYATRLQSGLFRNIAISLRDDLSSVAIPSLLIEKAEKVVFENCVLYHLLTQLDATAGVVFGRCVFFGGITGSKLVSQTTYQPGGGQGISEYPKFDECFFSGHPVDLTDTVDALFMGCHFLGGAYGIQSRRLNATGSGGQIFYMGPSCIGCTFDSMDGHAIDVDFGGTNSRIIGCFISAGRTNGVAGLRLANCINMQIMGNEINWCGSSGVILGSASNLMFSGNTFVNQAAGQGIRIGGGCSKLSIQGNIFLNTNLWGGSTTGFTDRAVETPASDLTDSIFAGNIISGMTVDAAYIAGTNNQIANNPGWTYGLSGYGDEGRINGTKVIGVRNTGWTAATGTGSKGAFAAAVAGTANAAYVQADTQAVLNRIAALEARLKSYDDALFAHGLIGA